MKYYVKTVFISFLVLLSTSVYSQQLRLSTGLGINLAGDEASVNHSLQSMAVFIEPGYRISEQSQLRYSLEFGAKFEGEVVEESLPPLKYGANYLINQYVKYIRYLDEGRSYAGLGYLLHYQRPYDTQLDNQGGFLSTSRINQFGHGTGVYLGIDLSRISLEGSYHVVFGTFNNFGALKIGYRIF